ncbi:MAG TPA: DUF4238 domain-containing protein [Woeseiaceae bacterium]|nr:DUF4238 domain-containing protein [Woeseiaceae bacterium]
MSFTTRNHYVPQWYQERFLAPGRAEDKYYYLDLNPEKVARVDGGHFFRNELRRLGPVSCFKMDHLYTLRFGEYAFDIVEKQFFGEIDSSGCNAVDFFHDYSWRAGSNEAFNSLIRYMDAQKLRTPKGLEFLKKLTGASSHQDTLKMMGSLFQMHATLWTESVWEVLYCDNSPTKFIISDHPVTTYNKGHFPGSPACKFPLDSLVETVGTHTLFPVDLNRCLVITNLGYVRNPQINPTKPRVNPRYFNNSVFDLRKIQTERQIDESYVRAVNYVIKQRANRYIAAGDADWLYPEKHLPTRMWNKLGGRDFLMPDPRKVHFTTQFIASFKDGSAWGQDEYGRKSDDNDPKVNRLRDKELRTFHASQEAWDSRYGPLDDKEWGKYMVGPDA